MRTGPQGVPYCGVYLFIMGGSPEAEGRNRNAARSVAGCRAGGYRRMSS